jgi:circadian clock protein KaiC
MQEGKIRTGIPGFDKTLEGGIEWNSVVMVRGGTGTGKTLFCLQYLYMGASQYNEPGIFLSFAESKNAIYTHGSRFGWDFEKLENKKKFLFIQYAPHEIVKVIEEGGGSIRDTIESIGAKRLVIDSISAYALLFENEYKADQNVLSLFELVRSWNCTTLVTSEKLVRPEGDGEERLGFLTDGIVNMYHMRDGKTRKRSLEVVKMRDTNHSDRIWGFKITNTGVAIQR